MNISPRLLSLFLTALLLAAASIRAQVPATVDPTKKSPPAEIVPPKPELRPPSGQKTVEPASPAALSPGTKPPPTAAPEAPLHQAIEALSAAELDQIITVLKERYVSPMALNELELKRAAVQGLLARLGPGASLNAGPAAAPAVSPFRAEIIDTRAGYLRCGTLNREMLEELDKALAGFGEKGLASVILDFRATPPGTDFELAAEFCRRFCPKGKVLFTVHRQGPASEQIHTAKTDPKFRGLLLVLLDADTAGSAEIIAGVLRAQARAIIIGQHSKGEAAEFAEAPLAEGHRLRYAVAEARLPDGAAVLAGGITPDLPVEVPAATLASVLKQALEGGVAPLLVEAERPRMNEAALVAGTNPEIDAVQAAQRLRGERKAPILRDDMLLRALDLITSLSVLKKP